MKMMLGGMMMPTVPPEATRRRGEVLVVAGLGHLRVHDRADGGRGRRVRARDRGEHAAGAERRHGHAAAHPAEHGIGEIRQPLGDAGIVDQVAGEDEERQREQPEEVEALVERHADIGEGEVDDDADADHPQADDQEDRTPITKRTVTPIEMSVIHSPSMIPPLLAFAIVAL